MKKLLLFLATGLVVTSTNAQTNQSVVLEQNMTVRHQVNTPASQYHANKSEAVKKFQGNHQQDLAKGTTAGSGFWFSHWLWADSLAGSGTVSSRLFPIWFDSTVTENFSSGLGTINFSAVGEVSNVSGFNYFGYSPLLAFGPNTIKVTPTNAYTVDSVSILAAYVKNITRPTTVVDTLIFSAVVNTHYSYITQADAVTYAFALTPNDYAPGHDTLYWPRIFHADSVGRAAWNDAGFTTQLKWKVPLTDAMRTPMDPVTGNVTLTNFTFPVSNGTTANPMPLQVPAGKDYAVTCVFKSGDTWIHNVDTVDQHHHFLVLTDEPNGAGTQMPYHWYDDNDRNMSQLLFSTDSAYWYPTNEIEAINGAQYSQEFHDISTFINCATCGVLGVANVSNNITVNGAFPVPAVNTVNIPFSLATASNVTITLANTVGQVVKTLELGKVEATGKATFNVADLANGVYFYTISAGEQKVTNRFVVAH
ncbi:MAG: T9SS type A sorting domain-containing protein [Bacteroidota bacterium]